jgi:hypothetical protein
MPRHIGLVESNAPLAMSHALRDAGSSASWLKGRDKPLDVSMGCGDRALLIFCNVKERGLFHKLSTLPWICFAEWYFSVFPDSPTENKPANLINEYAFM